LKHRVDFAFVRRCASGFFTEDFDAAKAWLLEARNQAQASGFARAAWPEHGEKLSFLYRNGDVIDSFNSAIMAAYIGKLNGDCHKEMSAN
jgi:hypothetical protein